MSAQKSTKGRSTLSTPALQSQSLHGDHGHEGDRNADARRGPLEISRAITDAVTQSNLVTLGSAPAYALGQTYIGGSQAQGLLFANMVQNQGELSAQGRAVTQESAHLILAPDTRNPAEPQALTAEQQRGPLMSDDDTGTAEGSAPNGTPDGSLESNGSEGAFLTSTASGAPVTTNTNVNLEGLDEALQTLMGGRPVVT